MVFVFPLARTSPTFCRQTVSLFISISLATCLVSRAAGDPTTPNILPCGSFVDVGPGVVPWAGVDGTNNIHGLEGSQLRVDDSGGINAGPFGPSVAVGDLNGDGKPDLVLGDSRGYFWYFPNSGTVQAPAFTQGEVIPIWLGDEGGPDSHNEGLDNIVPRIQLVDFAGLKKLDVVAGTYSGALFHIPNSGSTEQPNFKPTQNRTQLLINTHKRGLLWCNYLAPCFTTAFDDPNAIDKVLDLIVGEGTYSANSIWFLHNTDSNDHPMFDEDHFKRIIPGMGLEQLTPAVIDWSHNGKTDIICGDRTGYINHFVNTSNDPQKPTFAPGVHVKVGGEEKLGGSLTVTVCDLTNNHLPNLLIGKDDGTILYAQNTGTPGKPDFDGTPKPLTGVLPPTYHFTALSNWSKNGAWGEAYEMLGATNPQLEPRFKFPDGVNAKYALKFWVWPYKNMFFQRYYLPEENQWNQHGIHCGSGVTLKMNTRYLLHFWVMAPDNSVSNFRWALSDGGRQDQKWTPPGVGGDIPTSSTWTEITKSFRIDNEPDPTIKEYGYAFDFNFYGQATFYVCDLQIQEDDN